MKHILILLFILPLVTSTVAQQVAPPTPPAASQTQRPEDAEVVRITTNLVQVDAVITDNHGKLVADLKPEEVEIFEDGHKQKITNFTFNLSESTPVERPASTAKADRNAPVLPPAQLRREEMQAGRRLADFYGTYHVRVCYSCAKRGFANKTRDRGLILTQSLAQHLHSHCAMRSMLRTIYGGGTPFPNEGLEGVACDLGPNQ